MRIRNLAFAGLAAAFALYSCGPKTPAEEPVVVMETSMGTIELKIYNETPKHRDNFLKLVDEGVYDSLLFHRVIENFMIQGGDIDSKNADAQDILGNGDLGYKVPAEFCIDKGIFHKRGALAAAREGDNTNPKKGSSSCQFYIVWGRSFTPEELDALTEASQGALTFSEEARQAYTTIGGTPHLDGNYTVFGEVVSGLEVVDAIQRVETGFLDRPVEDVRIISVRRK